MSTQNSEGGRSGEESSRQDNATWIPRNAHPYAWAALAVTWAVWAFNVVAFYFISALSPVIISEFGLTAVAFSFFVAGTYAVRAVFDMPLSAWSDRIGSGWRRRVLWAPIILLYAIISALTAIKGLSASVWSFFALRSFVNLTVVC